MLENHGSYLTSALLLCFGDSPEEQWEIKGCRGAPDELLRYCNHLSDSRVQLYFIIDQYNAFDSEEENKDDIGNARKTRVAEWLNEVTSGHCTIKSASANYKAAMHMQQKHTNEINVVVYGGFTEARSPPCMS
jgi:hypothetical protein